MKLLVIHHQAVAMLSSMASLEMFDSGTLPAPLGALAPAVFQPHLGFLDVAADVKDRGGEGLGERRGAIFLGKRIREAKLPVLMAR